MPAPRCVRRGAALAFCLIALQLWGQQPGRKTPDIRGGVFRGQPVTFEVIGGLAILEGDIILGQAAEIEAARVTPQTKPASDDRSKAIYRDGQQYLWPGGLIPYTIDPVIPNPQRILDAIRHWNERTPIRIEPRSSETNYLHFRHQNSGGVCYSALGMLGGQQSIAVDDTCGVGTLVHEIGHTAGFYHEQSRLDRDAYVRVLYENIEPGREGQFDPPYSSGSDIGRYDYASIMHYGGGYFSKNAKPTIVSIPPGIPFGQRSSLSQGDLDAVRWLYGEAPGDTVIATNPDGVEIIVDGERFAAPRTFAWAPGTTHTIGVPSSLPGTGSTRWGFARWSDDGAETHAITAGPAETVYTANFVRQLPFTAKVAPEGAGTVTVEPPSADGYYALGTELRVTATAAPGFAFSHWTQPGGRALHGRSANPATVASAAYDYVANFTSEPLVTIATAPEGLSLVVDGETLLSPASYAWGAGTSHTVSVEETATLGGVSETRYTFRGWSDYGPRSRLVTASGETARFTASYAAQHQLVGRASPPLGGAVSVVPASPDGFHDEGAAIELSAAAAPGYKFARWSGDLTGGENPRLLTVSRPLAATAVFGVPGEVNSGYFLSAATLLRGPAVPGGLFTILGVDIGPEHEETLKLGPDGKVLAELAGTRVLFDGFAAPLIYVSRNQINGVTPFSASGNAASVVRVVTGGKQSPPITVPVADARPGVFTLDASGKGQGAILNEDGSVNSPANPAACGSVIALFAAGAGQTDPPGEDGKLNTFPLPKPLLPAEVRIGGRLAEVQYAGAAPELVAGVLQVNARVPCDILPGGAVPVVLTVGEAASLAAVTVAVR